MRHYNGAPRAILRPLAKRNEDGYLIKDLAYIRRRFSNNLECTEVRISTPAEFFDCEKFDSVCVYGDDLTTLVTAKVIGMSAKYDMLIGKFEFRNGVACFDAQLYPTTPEDIQDVLLITDKDIMGRNYGLGMVGVSIGYSSIYAVVLPVNLLVTGKIPLIKMSKEKFYDELRRQIDIFLKERNLLSSQGV